MRLEHNGISIDLEKIKSIDPQQYPWIKGFLIIAKERIEENIRIFDEDIPDPFKRG